MQENVQSDPISVPVPPVTEVSEQSTELEQKTPTTVHGSQNSFLTILLSVLLALAVLIAGFFAYQTQKLVKELQVTSDNPTPTSQAIATQTPDPTADWKTYTNNEFTFKYPQSYTFADNKISSADNSIEIWTYDSKGSIFNECMNLDKSEKVGNLLVKSFSGVTTGAMCDPKNTINLREKWIVNSVGLGFAPGLQFSYKSTNTEAESIFNQILSTFKFTNSNVTSNWKTYRNTSSNYQIMYPIDWKLTNQSAGSLGEIVPDARYVEIGLGDGKSGTIGIEELQMIPPSEEPNLNTTKTVGNVILRCNGAFTTDTKSWCWVKVPNQEKYLNIQVFKNTKDDMNSILDQILSTFRFEN